MGKRIALGVFAKVEMDQKRDATICLLLDLEWQHDVRHKAVKNQQLTWLIGDPLPMLFRTRSQAIALEKTIHLVRQITLMPNIQVAPGLIDILRCTLN